MVGAEGPLLEAVLDEPPLVPLLDELKVQGDHVLLQLGDGGLHCGDVGEQLLGLQRVESVVGTNSEHHARRRPGQGLDGEVRACAYVGGEVGHVGEGDGGVVERVLEDAVQRRLLPQHLLQPLHLQQRGTFR